MLDALRALLAQVRLELVGAGEAVVWEGRTTPIPGRLPLDDLDPFAERGELMAIAAALEAAVKYPAKLVPGEDFRTGAAALLPKLERRRFVATYEAVRGGGDEALLWRDFGAGLVVCYVEDQGWRFQYMARGRFAGWDTSLDTVHSGARSNLYHRAALDWRALEVAVGDGYDAARAVILDDVFYDRMGPEGIAFAVPSRDLLLVGTNERPLVAEVVRHAYDVARYPLSPEIHAFAAHRAHALRALAS